jgi:hypothetical protein
MPKTLDPLLSSLTPEQLAVITLYGEARGEPIEGQVAVAHVFRNRVLRGDWGPSLASVLGGWAQFSCLWPTLGGKNYTKVMEAAQRYREEGAFSPLFRQLEWVVSGVFGEKILDNTQGACHYYASGTPTPFWAVGDATYVGQKGRHLFFAGVK